MPQYTRQNYSRTEIITKLFLFFIFSNASLLWAQTATGRAINLYVENDSRDLGGPGSDNAYSNGLKLSYIASENDIPQGMAPFINYSRFLQESLENSKSNFGLSIGHQIYTPNDIRAQEHIADDRPYAAWLYLGFSAHFKNEYRSHSIELDLGLIGPEAGGESLQNGYHNIIGKYSAEGWENQLHTEATLQLSYQQRMKIFSMENAYNGKYLDFIPFFGGGLGNVAIDVYLGGMFRIGSQLPDDYGPSRPSLMDGDNFSDPIADGFPPTSIYAFASARIIGVARNIFLDGNTFRSSYKVDKNPVVVETDLGAVLIYRQWNLAWRFVTRSPEFKQRSVVNSFASISVAYAY